jgi:hypothetical protein
MEIKKTSTIKRQCHFVPQGFFDRDIRGVSRKDHDRDDLHVANSSNESLISIDQLITCACGSLYSLGRLKIDRIH